MLNLLLPVIAALSLTVSAQAQTPVAAWPSKPIHIVVPTGAGGNSLDTYARFVAEEFSKTLGQPVVVENKPGANGMIGTQTVAKAEPDGHTLLFTYGAAHVVTPSLYDTPYDALADFTAVAQMSSGGTLLLVPASLPVHNLDEFIAYVRARPGELSYGSWGTGSGGHLAMEALKRHAGLDLEHVPYKSPNASLNDLVGGNIQAAFGDVTASRAYIQADRLRPLAITGTERFVEYPEVKTMTEQGVPFDLDVWLGIFAPAGVPTAIIQRLNTELNRLLTDPELAPRLKTISQWTRFKPKSPEEYAQMVERDYHAWAKLIRDNDIRGE